MSGAAVTCNGAPVGASQWLEDGDRIRAGQTSIAVASANGLLRFAVEATATDEDEITAPPVLLEGSGDLDVDEEETNIHAVTATSFRPRSWA